MEIERKQRSLVHFRRFADFGDLENGVPHGRGTMKSADGSFYEGDFEKTLFLSEVLRSCRLDWNPSNTDLMDSDAFQTRIQILVEMQTR